MADLDDLRLNEPEQYVPPAAPPATGPPLLLPVLVIAIVVGVVIAVIYWPRGTPQTAAAKAVAASPVPASTRPVAEPGATIALPPLDDTDALVRQLVSQLSSHPRVAAWLATNGLLRNVAVVVANIADGDTPTKALATQRPTVPFAVRESGTAAFIDPQSYHRYDAYADAVAGLDARGTARLYATLKPRIAEAYRDLGYPDGDIDAALERAFIVLLRTPTVGESIPLKRTSVNWQYADPNIESLPRAQRQLLRMGPRNEALIQNKLRDMAPYLGFDPARLPAR